MKKTKVIVCNLTPRLGMLHYSSQFCNELNKRKDISLKVAIASYYSGELYDKDIWFIKIRSNPSLWSFIFDTLNLLYQAYFLLQILLFLPDRVHFIDNHPWYSIYVYIFKFVWITVYTTQHDPILHTGENKKFVWKIAWYTNHILRKKSDILIVHGDTIKKQVSKIYGIPKKKIISVPHGAYTFFNTFSKWLKVQKDTFLFFWRILDYKWLDTLLESLKYIEKDFPDFRLIIAWPGDIFDYTKLLKKYQKNINIYNRNIEAEEAYTFFEISEFVVLPYHDATGTGVIPVAYSFKKPVIVTNVWELSSVVDDKKTGYIIPSNKPKELAKAITIMLQDKNKTIKMWASWYTYSLEELSWKPIIDKIYTIWSK